MGNHHDVAGVNLSARDGGLYPPISVVISWPAPNYINPTTHDWKGPIILMSVMAFTFTVFTARIWARMVVGKNAGLDDLLMSIAMIPLLGLTVAAFLGEMN